MIYNESQYNHDWKTMKLSQLGVFARGKSKHRPRDDAKLFEGGGYPLVQTGEIKEANLFLVKHEKEYGEFGLSQSKLWEAGTLCITIAANIAETAILQYPMCFPDSVVGFNAYQDISSEIFMYYVFNYIKNAIQKSVSGSVQDNININYLTNLDFKVPSKIVQDKIVAILYSIDKRIILNNEINRNLLEQAIAVFKEKIWSKDKNGTIGDYCIMKSGFAFKSSWWTDDGVKVIKIGDINQDNLSLATCSHVDEDKVEKAGDFSVKAGDLVLAMTGATIGKFAMVPERSETILVNQRVGKFFLGEEPLKKVPFIYCTLKMDDVYSEVIGRGQGSAQPNISGSDVMTIPCVIPTDIEIDEFNEFAEPIFASIVKNQNENEKLANLRDSLLPKLMSGELDISDLDI